MMVCVRQEEIDRVRRRNCRIRNANHILKTTLKNLCDRPYSECDKILQSVVDMCKKTPCEFNCNHPCCCPYPVACLPSCPPSCPPRQCSASCYCTVCRPVRASCVTSPCCASKTTKCYCTCCVGLCPETCCPRKPSSCCKPCTQTCCTRSLSPCRKPCPKPNLCCSPPKRRSKSFCSSKRSSCCIPAKVCDDSTKCNRKDTFAGVLGRLGAGCSSGGCGGYTPSGWNKIMTKTRALCDSDPCTCCTPSNPCRPSCTPSNPCRPSCNPCKSCSPCKPYNPCDPCSPCKPYNPCDPCNPCSPCKPYNPCNPCSPCKPYNPCNPCSPCKLYNPCNPCSPCKPYNPCNPCKPYNPCSPCKPYTSCNPCKPYNPCSDSTCPPYKFKSLCRPTLCCTDICNSQAPSDDCAKSRPSLKLLGELAFQLERRILDYVFGMEDSKRRRFYGYTVSNIFSMMERETKFPKGGSDVITKSELAGRLKKLLQALERYGYNIKTHGEFAQEMVNKYGLLACPPDESTIAQFGLTDPNAIAHLIQQLAQGPSEISSLTVLLNSLKYLSKCDQRPLFIW